MQIKNSINTSAKTAGLLYLLIAVCGGFAFFAGYENLMVISDAVKTVNNIMQSEGVFRLGIIGDALLILGEIVLTVLLYLIFKPVDKTVSLIAASARLAMTAMIGMNLLNKLIVLHLLGEPEYLAVFEQAQLYALAMVILKAYGYGSLIWGVFFGLHLALIGYLILKSNFIPRILGALFVFASFGYLVYSFCLFGLPQYDQLYKLIIFSTIPAELSLALWLLFKGVHEKRWLLIAKEQENEFTTISP